MNIKSRRLAAVAFAALAGCGDDGGDTVSERAVLQGYATSVHAAYAESLARAQAMKTAIDTFVGQPSQANLDAAKQAWLAARDPYGQTEAYRFYDGPIDDPDTGPEGELNAWPLDEVFIDYVDGEPAAGIINNAAMFPTLSVDVLAMQNENGGEKNIATGYHAIEFLLWGQDRSATGPGARPYTDYLTTGGTASNQARRGQYLKLAAELVVTDLQEVTAAWAPGQANYAADMIDGEPKEGLRRIFQGMGALAGAELSGERMTTAIDNRDQEDEHSCFSDNTHKDLYANAVAVRNAYLSTFGSVDGVGLDELVASKDEALDLELKTQLDAAITAIQAIPVPFDQAIQSADGRATALAAVRALQDATETIVEAATALGVTINLE